MRKRVPFIVIGVVGLSLIAWAVARWDAPQVESPPVAVSPIIPATPATNPVVIVDEPIEVLPSIAVTTAPIVAEVAKPTPAPAVAAKVVEKNKKPVQVARAAGAAGKPAKQPKQPKEPLTKDQLFARDALSLVGADRDAEAVWVSAINDPSRSEHERKDLIEDLNEEGFDDPKNVTPDDLPLIVNRLGIIEELAPNAMDEVNDAAFAEAYKDLMNMYRRASQQ